MYFVQMSDKILITVFIYVKMFHNSFGMGMP